MPESGERFPEPVLRVVGSILIAAANRRDPPDLQSFTQTPDLFSEAVGEERLIELLSRLIAACLKRLSGDGRRIALKAFEDHDGDQVARVFSESTGVNLERLRTTLRELDTGDVREIADALIEAVAIACRMQMDEPRA